MVKLFIEPGDKLTSEDETIHFHKNVKYEVSNVYSVPGKVGIIVYVFNKFGEEIPLECQLAKFQLYPDRVNDKRKWLARLDFFWNAGVEMAINRAHNFEVEGEYYEVSRAHFLNNPDAKAAVHKTKRYFFDGSPRYQSISSAYFKSKLEYYDYMTKELGKTEIDYNFKVAGSSDIQKEIDFLQWYGAKNFPPVDAEKFTNDLEKNKWIHASEVFNDFDLFLQHIIVRSFDKAPIGAFEKQLIVDIVTLFSVMPPSYGSTAITKIFRGQGKTDTTPMQPYKGKYKDLWKYDQLFGLVDYVESFCYINKIFIKKEDYSTGTIWRDQFEFIGNKAIDKTKLAEFIQKVKDYGA